MKKLNSNLGNKNTIVDIMSNCRCVARCGCTSAQKSYTTSLNEFRRLDDVGSTTGGPEPY